MTLGELADKLKDLAEREEAFAYDEKVARFTGVSTYRSQSLNEQYALLVQLRNEELPF